MQLYSGSAAIVAGSKLFGGQLALNKNACFPPIGFFAESVGSVKLPNVASFFFVSLKMGKRELQVGGHKVILFKVIDPKGFFSSYI